MSQIIGLTGQTGAGKTVASNFFCDNGFAVINCDTVAREVVQSGSDCLCDLVTEFSSAILTADMSLNRKYLGSIVFSDKEKLNRLNKIMFPYITAGINERIFAHKASGAPFILLDAPTLFESEADKFCHCIISIIAKISLRQTRIMQRDCLSQIEAQNRISSQHDDDFFEHNSHYIIENNNGHTEFLQKLEEVRRHIVKEKN